MSVTGESLPFPNEFAEIAHARGIAIPAVARKTHSPSVWRCVNLIGKTIKPGPLDLSILLPQQRKRHPFAP